MVKNSEQLRSRSVLAGKRTTSSDSGSKTNEENYSAHPPSLPSLLPSPLPPSTSQRSFSDGSDRSETLRITTSLLDTNSIERLLKVAQEFNARRRDGSEENPRRTTARSREATPRSDDSLRNIRMIGKDNETKLLPPEELQTRNDPPRVAKSPSPSTQTAFFSRDPRTECVANAADLESRQFQNADATRHSNDSVVSQAAAVDAKSFDADRQSSNTAPGRIGPRRQDETTADVLCRGYSNQRRHGRKASLGTTDITRLIPTLVSENEGFRDQEYQRKISLPSAFNGTAQNLAI